MLDKKEILERANKKRGAFDPVGRFLRLRPETAARWDRFKLAHTTEEAMEILLDLYDLTTSKE